jgi:peptidoglycan/xylan/chitin deacetylase (PgdA/CDA1 family)
VIATGPVTFVPILMYHYIRVNPNPRDRVGFGLSTTPAMFHAQMQYLADHGFRVISLHQAATAIATHTPLPTRAVVLTFDDGYADFFTAAIPELRSHGFTATDFVISGRMGMWNYMTRSQVAAAAAMGFNIGAHTVDHFALAALAPARAVWEMRTSKQALEALLAQPVLDFAYPYGSYDRFVAIEARTLGFEAAASSNPGVLHWAGQLMYLSRMRVGGGLSLRAFAGLVAGPAPTAAEIGLGGQPAPNQSPSPSPSPSRSPSASPSVRPSPSPTIH